MSEHEAYVACRCWRDGKATPPPVDPATLTFDRYGQVCPVGLPGLSSSDDEDLWAWWEDRGQASSGPNIIAESELAARALDERHGFFEHTGGAREQHLSDAGWPFVELCDFLRVSVETGYPLVGYYNGCSLGFDE